MTFELRPLKQCCAINPEVLRESTDPEMEIEYIDIGNVSLHGGINGVEIHRFEDAPSRARRIVHSGDVLIATVRTYLRAIARVDEARDAAIASTGFAVLRASEVVDRVFLYRVIQSEPFIQSVVQASVGVSYPAINSSTLGTLPIPVPNVSYQKSVAEFLEQETEHIDAMIKKVGGQTASAAAQPRSFLSLLLEKRSALITAAVTGQIDPVEWRRRGEGDRRLDQIEAEMTA